MRDISTSNITKKDKKQVLDILDLSQELCNVDDVFVLYNKCGQTHTIASKKIEPLNRDKVLLLSNQVVASAKMQSNTEVSSKTLFFSGFPIFDTQGNACASLCILNTKKIVLKSFEKKTIGVFTKSLAVIFEGIFSQISSHLLKSDNLLILDSVAPYFIIIDESFKVQKLGSNFSKSLSDFEVGKSIFDFFLLDRADNLDLSKLSHSWFGMMHFLDSKDHNQRYKCTIKKVDGLFFIIANPVINSKFSLNNYKVSVGDFPSHDSIVEYLFLEQTSRRSLEESRKTTKNLIQKNKEIIRFQKEIKTISTLPGENPNPILRFDLNLNLVFNNLTSEKSFLSDLGIHKGTIKKGEVRTILEAIIKNKKSYEQFFFEGKENYYSVNIALIMEMGYLNVYAHDITDYRSRNRENELELKALNSKNQAQKEFYEFILNNIPSDIAVFDKEHKYVFINPQGIKDPALREYMMGKDDYDYCKLKGISNGLADGRRALFNQILEKKESEVWLDDMVDENGNRKVIQRSMGPLFDEKGVLRMAIGYGTDITQRVIAEEENVKLSLVAKNTNNGVLMLDKEMLISWANRAMIDRSGYSLKEMIGKHPRTFISEEQESIIAEEIQKGIRLKQNVEVEMMRQSKTGRDYWVLVNLQPLFDMNQEHTGYMMVEFDITDRINNEKTIRNLNVNLERLVQEKTAKNMELASSLRDQEKMVTIGELASGVAHDLNTPLGAIKSGTENIHYTLDLLFKSYLPKCSSREIQHAFNRSLNASFELFIGGVQMKREKEFLLSYLKALKTEFEVKALADIALLMVKNRIKTNDTDEISFALKAKDPILFLNMMYNVQMAFSFLQTISNSGSRASEVVQNLRLFITEKRNADLGMVNVHNNMKTVLNVFSHMIHDVVSLKFDVDETIEVKGFDVRLFQLWSNLLKNALECMEEQRSKVLKLYSEVTSESYIITVENNGPEISNELKSKMFNKFFTTKEKSKGSGLGLSIVKNVLEEHMGKLKLISNKKSTKFVITFKREK